MSLHMSMSWEHTCRKCGKDFDSVAPRATHCYKCTETSKIKDLAPNKIIKVTDSGGYKHCWLFVHCLQHSFGEMEIITNDPDWELVLYADEINTLENVLGHKLNWVQY